jgi:hypothetical protein
MPLQPEPGPVTQPGEIRRYSAEYPGPADVFPIGSKFMRPKKSVWAVVDRFKQKKSCID